MNMVAGLSPPALARAAGACYVVEGITSAVGQLVIPALLVVPGHPGATAANILQHECWFRLGLVATLVAVTAHVAQTVLLAELLLPAGRLATRMFTVVSVVAIGLQVTCAVLAASALIVLRDAETLTALTVDQWHALTLVALTWRAATFNMFLVLFGLRCVSIGWLLQRAWFLPRYLGVLMTIAGLAYVVLIWPPLAASVAPYHLVAAAPGELSLVFWLLVKGVDIERWEAQRCAGGVP